MKGRSAKRPSRRRPQTLASKHKDALAKLRRSIMFLLSRPEEVAFVLAQMESISYRREWVEERLRGDQG